MLVLAPPENDADALDSFDLVVPASDDSTEEMADGNFDRSDTADTDGKGEGRIDDDDGTAYPNS